MEVPQPMSPVCPRCEKPCNTLRCPHCRLVIHRLNLFRIERDLLYTGGMGIFCTFLLLVTAYFIPWAAIAGVVIAMATLWMSIKNLERYRNDGWILSLPEMLFLLFDALGRITIIWLTFGVLLNMLQFAIACIRSGENVLGAISLFLVAVFAARYVLDSTRYWWSHPLSRPEQLGFNKTLQQAEIWHHGFRWTHAVMIGIILVLVGFIVWTVTMVRL